MIIKSIMTDEDRKALEYMLSLEYAMPYQLLKTKNNRRKIIYITDMILDAILYEYWNFTRFNASSSSSTPDTDVLWFAIV